MKEPNHDDAERCIAIRKRSKRGEYYPPEDHAFCQKMMEDYPEWYEATDERVFNETRPFGSNVKYRR